MYYIYILFIVTPSIIGNNEERIVILKGASVIMNCSYEGSPEPEVIWFFNEIQIEEADANLVYVICILKK